MKRKIIFRGKRLDSDTLATTSEWVYGFYVEGRDGTAYIRSNTDWLTYLVDPTTLGQLFNEKGFENKDLYEGDIVAEMREVNCLEGEQCPYFNPKNNEDHFCDAPYHRAEGCPKVPDYKKIHIVDLDTFRRWLNDEQWGYEGEDLINPNSCKVIGNIYDECDWGRMDEKERREFFWNFKNKIISSSDES